MLFPTDGNVNRHSALPSVSRSYRPAGASLKGSEWILFRAGVGSNGNGQAGLGPAYVSNEEVHCPLYSGHWHCVLSFLGIKSANNGTRKGRAASREGGLGHYP